MKKTTRKLTLDRETLRSLGTSAISRVVGGVPANSGEDGCPTEWATCKVSCNGTCHMPCGTQDPTGAGN